MEKFCEYRKVPGEWKKSVKIAVCTYSTMQ